jgi:hypothetical protein
MAMAVKIYLTVKQTCIILDALELFEAQVPGAMKGEISDMRTGLSIALPIEFLYPENERETINTNLVLANPGERWIGKFNATYPREEI